jgi:hypothetical protein
MINNVTNYISNSSIAAYATSAKNYVANSRVATVAQNAISKSASALVNFTKSHPYVATAAATLATLAIIAKVYSYMTAQKPIPKKGSQALSTTTPNPDSRAARRGTIRGHESQQSQKSSKIKVRKKHRKLPKLDNQPQTTIRSNVQELKYPLIK